MLPPIVCTCGLPIGDIARKFLEMKNEAIKNKLKDLSDKVDPNNVIYLNSESENLTLESIFKALGDPPLCCRTQINTNMQFSDYY
jgi:DNA-directed RNA polymerase subunit N (RpoN/RPB10)